jgi:outer membrane cobalamin receptor
LTSVLVLALLTAAAAAPADSLWSLEEMVVHGDSLSAVTVHGSRILTVSGPEVERLGQRPGRNSLAAAATLPGVSYHQVGLISAGASGNPPWAFRMRGVGAVPNDGLLVLVDGRPQLVGFWGHALPDAHPLGPVRRVEVIRGPATVPFGGQAFAGAIQVITRGGPDTRVQAAGGSHGTWQAQARHAGPAGPLTVDIAGSAAATDGYRGGDESDLQALRMRATASLGERWRVSGLVEGSNSTFNNPGPLSAPYPDPRTGSGAIRQRTLELDIEGAGETWSAFLRGYSGYVHNDFHGEGNTRARDLGLRAGGEWNRTRWSFKGGLDLDRNGGTFNVNGNPDFVEVDAHHTTTAPYLMAGWEPDRRWQLGTGLRLQLSDTYDTEWIPQAKAVFLPDGRGALTLSAARGVKVPAVAQQYLPFFAGPIDAIGKETTWLAPESMWQYELAADRSWGAWNAMAAVFHAEGENLIRLEQPGWPPQYGNSGAFVHQGLDATLAWRPGPDDLLRLGAAWMWRRDAQTLATPALAIRFDGSWQARAPLVVDATVELAWDRYGADEAQEPLDDLLLLAGGVTWRTTREIALFGRVDNLLDADYAVFADYPMPPRTWSAGVRWVR